MILLIFLLKSTSITHEEVRRERVRRNIFYVLTQFRLMVCANVKKAKQIKVKNLTNSDDY